MRLPGMLEPLRIRDFALLWTGMTVSLVGDFFFFVALAWQTYELSGSPAALGWISAAYTAPLVLFLLAGGVLTDRVERRRMMIAGDLIRVASVGTAGGLSIAGDLRLWQFALLAGITGLGDALFAPAFGSIVPEIVPAELLPQANALDQFVRPAAGLIGPALGGVVIAIAGAGTALAIDAGTFCVSTATALALTPRPSLSRPGGRQTVLADLREGFAFVRGNAWLWGTLTAAGVMNIASASRNVLLPFIVKNDIHGSARSLGLVYSASGVGALMSAFVYGQRGLPRRHVLVMYVGWALSLFMIAAYGVAENVPELVAAAFVAGIGLAVSAAIWGTMMHRLVPRDVLGRVTSVDWMVSVSLMPVASIGVGFVAAAAGSRETLVGAGLLGGCLTAVFLFAIPHLRDSERDGSMAAATIADSRSASEALPDPLREPVQP